MSSETVNRLTQPWQQNQGYEHAEGPIAKAIEHHTAKLPSDLFLWAAGASIAGSLALKVMGRDHDAHFIANWAPTLLILGLYNKLVKVAGSDRVANSA